MAAKQKIKISKIGVGGKVIDVRLKDKTKAKGYITEIRDDHFVLVDRKSAASTRISYDQIREIRRPLTVIQKAAFGIGVLVFGVVTAICIANGTCDD